MNVVTQIVLPLSLAVIMFAMGLGLVPADFGRVVKEPKGFTLGALMQVLALPLIGLGVASLWTDNPVIAVGIMLLAACPGGATSNLLTHIGRGDVALSITLTAVISLLGMFTVPFILDYALQAYMGADAPPLPLGKTVFGVFAITTVPVILGMLVKARAPDFAAAVEKRSRLLSGVLFAIIMAGAIASEWKLIVDNVATILPTMIGFNVVMMLLAAGVAKVGRLPSKQQITVTLECGLQNGTLAVVVAGTMLERLDFAIPAGIYSIWMFISALAYIFVVDKTRTDDPDAPVAPVAA